MLKKCPECELNVSDKAMTCPHCGYPISGKAGPSSGKKKTRRRRRLPNGFGQISEIRGRNLRKPFRAMVTTGKDPSGRLIVKPLKPNSYFETYNDAYAALVEYNRNPYDLDERITVEELYERWSSAYFKTLGAISSARTIQTAWHYCESIYDMRVSDLRARHIKGVMEEGTAEIRGAIKRPSPVMKTRIKSLFNLMLDYALEYELVDRNYARTFELSNDLIKEVEDKRCGHIPFSKEEIDKLWSVIDAVKWVDVILYQCYSGWRPQELGWIRIEDVDLENGFITGGMKTDAGRNRIVPIHPRVFDIVAKHYKLAQSLGSEYLFNCDDTLTHTSNTRLSYAKYNLRFTKIVTNLKLNPDHKPHDGRVHFVTQAKEYKVDEYAIKRIIGHNITDLTERVYTLRTEEWLREEIEKII